MQSLMIITDKTQANTFFDSMFKKVPNLNDHFFISAIAGSRESALNLVEEGKQKPDITIFMEDTRGNTSISDTVYRLRLSGTRVIYITSTRDVGDPLLHTIVGYGVYDIILGYTLTIKDVIKHLLEPNSFGDAAIFHKVSKIQDSATKKEGFRIPDLEEIRQYNGPISTNYLQGETDVNTGEGNTTNSNAKKQSVIDLLFAKEDEKKSKKKKQKKQPQKNKPQPTKPKGSRLGDIAPLDDY